MIKRIDNTLNITAPTAVDIVLVGFLFGVGCAVVRRVSVHKTVRHDQVYHIRSSETLTLSATVTTLIDHVIVTRFLITFLKRDSIRTGSIHFHVHKQVVRALRIVLGRRHQTITCTAHQFAVYHLLYAYLRVFQIRTMKHQCQRSLHVRPPAQWLNLLNLRGSKCQLTHQQRSDNYHFVFHTIFR